LGKKKDVCGVRWNDQKKGNQTKTLENREKKSDRERLIGHMPKGSLARAGLVVPAPAMKERG